MRKLSIYSGIFLITIAVFSWGYFSSEYEFFPWQLIDPVRSFIEGYGPHSKTVTEKVKHALDIRPERMLEELEKSGGREYADVRTEGLRERRLDPQLYKEEGAFPEGYLLIWGAFDFEENLHGGVLLNADGEVVHRWLPDREAIEEEIEAYNKNRPRDQEKKSYKTIIDLPQGISLYPDGSLILNDGDHGNGMQRVDFCSDSLWVKLGKFSHEISKQDDGSKVWSVDDDRVLHKIDARSGDSLQELEVGQIMEANPYTDVLSIRRDDMLGDRWLDDRWHFNDFEPLPEEYAEAFPDFEAGDLLLSLRSLNAVMVVDPDTKEIKWWRVGAFSRQHDPDWHADGTITIFDNQTREVYGEYEPEDPKKYSRILRIDPQTFETEVVYHGRRDNFYTGIRGQHQVLPNGNILITSSTQGRIMIVDEDGETVFDFINRYDGEEALVLSDAVWVPDDFFGFELEEKRCGQAAQEE
ncbi:MAG: arylsulfotransferase family protein [Spirochaetia bacterium]